MDSFTSKQGEIVKKLQHLVHETNVALHNCIFRFPKSGSLIRAEKIDKFESLEKAIQERYLAPEQQSYVNDELLMEARDALSAPFMKVVGMEKLRERQSNLKFTEELTICHSTINQAGSLPALDSLRSLCLQSSCIANWKVVGEIVHQIPSLRSLDLSFNRLAMPGIEDDELKMEFIESLIINSCGLSDWKNVLAIARMCPALREFSLKQNDIRTIEDSLHSFPQLETLIISDNSISDFDEVLKLGNLPALMELLVNNNQLTSVKLPRCDYTDRLNFFKSLETLNLRHNPIVDEPSMFNELDKLPMLSRLSYMNLKAVEGGDGGYMDTFLQAAGMIEKLTYFNRSEIDKTQKNDAMYEMWKKFAAEWMQAGAEGEPKMGDFCQTHRCYPRLVKKYGSPDQLLIQQQKKRVTTIEIQFKNVTNGKMYRKKVPLAMTTHTLYGLIYKIAALHSCTGMDLKSFKLYYIDAYNNNIKVYLDNLSKSLDYYSLSNGDVIYIEK